METLAVIGSGTMGHSITLNAAWAGIDVKMYGQDEEDTGKGLLNLNKKLEVLLQNDLVTVAEFENIKARIRVTHAIEDAAEGATFIIETIPEDLVMKQALFIQLDKLCGPEVIIASNTSGLSITQIAGAALFPERILVTHFWNPAHLVPLVEVLRTDKTNDNTFVRAMDLLRMMNKKPIHIKKDVPGLVGNRLQFALFREAQYLLEEGIASKEDIDSAVINSLGLRLPVTGPILSADMGGLDVFAAISDYLFKDLSNAEHASEFLKKLVGENKLGDKTGEGFYTWDKEFSHTMNQRREQELIRFLKQDRENK